MKRRGPSNPGWIGYSLNSGHRACQGCGEALGGALRARCRHACQPQSIDCRECNRLSGGLFQPLSRKRLANSWMHSLFGNAPAVASRIAAALRAKRRDDVTVIAQGVTERRSTLGSICLSGMFERNDDVLHLCYDNEAYTNTGIQRSGATLRSPEPTRRKPWVSIRQPDWEREERATDCPRAWDPLCRDGLWPISMTWNEKSRRRSVFARGSVYPCARALSAGVGLGPAHTMKVARLAVESGLFPLFEANSEKSSAPRRFAAKFLSNAIWSYRLDSSICSVRRRTGSPRRDQAMADDNIAVYGLME